MAIVKAVNGPGHVTRVKKVMVGRPVKTATQSISDINTIQGVDMIGRTDGSVLVYNASTQLWTAQIELEKQDIIGGNF